MRGLVKDVNSKEELEDLLRDQTPAVLQFWASTCETCRQMDQVFCHLSSDFPYANFIRVDAKEQPEISEAFSVPAVPYFVFFKDSKVVDSLEGSDPASLANKVAKTSGSAYETEPAAPASLGMAAGPAILEAVKELSTENTISDVENSCNGLYDSVTTRIHELLDSSIVFLFMKGTPEQPKCSLSKKVVDILKLEGVEFGCFDVLSDDEVYDGLQKFSNCATFPQLFFKGDFIGDSDIATEMHESGELKGVLREVHQVSKDYETNDATGIRSSVACRMKSIIKTNPVMLFMRGTSEEPRCSFSRKAIEILQKEKVKFATFDVLSDDEVHEGLKVFSNWSSYPQLYIKGELIGGYEVIQEMEKSGELKRTLIEKGIISNECQRLPLQEPELLLAGGCPV